MGFTIGADIEVFGKRGDHHVALCGMIGGTKEAPKQVPNLPEGFMVQEDNVSLEFNIPVCTFKPEFVGAIAIMRNHCAELLKPMGLEVSDKSSFSFSKEELASPAAMVFGCEPDFDAWKKAVNKRPKSTDAALRTAGGHIHVGTRDVDMVDGIRAMDLFIGVPSILVDSSEESQKRRELYGKAGAMRPKPYGFEYRVMSNFWMFKDAYADWIYNQTNRAMGFCAGGQKISKSLAGDIQNCINNSDKTLAQKIVNLYAIRLPKEKEEKHVVTDSVYEFI